MEGDQLSPRRPNGRSGLNGGSGTGGIARTFTPLAPVEFGRDSRKSCCSSPGGVPPPPSLYQHVEFGFRFSVGVTLICVLGPLTEAWWNSSDWVTDLNRSAGPVFVLFTISNTYGRTAHRCLEAIVGALLGTLIAFAIWGMFSSDGEYYTTICICCMFVFTFAIFSFDVHISFKQFACGLGNWYLLTMADTSSSYLQSSFSDAWKVTGYGVSGMLFSLFVMAIPLPSCSGWRWMWSMSRCRESRRKLLSASGEAFFILVGLVSSGQETLQKLAIRDGQSSVASAVDEIEKLAREMEGLEDLEDSAPQSPGQMLAHASRFHHSVSHRVRLLAFQNAVEELSVISASITAITAEVPYLPWECVSRHSPFALQCEALMLTGQQMLEACRQMQDTVKAPIDGAMYQMLSHILPQVLPDMLQLHEALSLWVAEGMAGRLIVPPQDLLEVAQRTLEHIDEAMMSWQDSSLVDQGSFNISATMMQYSLVSAVTQFVKAIEDYEEIVETLQERSRSEDRRYLFGFLPAGFRCNFNERIVESGLKIALACTILAVLLTQASVVGDSNTYSPSGVFFLVFVMSGEDRTSSFHKSYNRILGLAGGIIVPTLVEGWIQCDSNVATGFFIWVWSFGGGIIYAGAVPGFEYAGLVSAFVMIQQMITRMDCSFEAAANGCLREDFLALVVLLVLDWVHYTLRPSGASVLFIGSMGEFWKRLAIHPDSLVNQLLNTYLLNIDTFQEEQHRGLDTQALGQLELLLVDAGSYLEQWRSEPTYHKEIRYDAYAKYVESASSVLLRFSKLLGAMRSAAKDLYDCETKKRVSALSYSTKGSPSEKTSKNPLLIADEAMYELFRSVVRQLKIMSENHLKAMKEGEFDLDMFDNQDNQFDGLMVELGLHFDVTLKRARGGGKAVYPNMKIIANHVLHSSLSELCEDFRCLDEALCGLSTDSIPHLDASEGLELPEGVTLDLESRISPNPLIHGTPAPTKTTPVPKKKPKAKSQAPAKKEEGDGPTITISFNDHKPSNQSGQPLII